MKKDVWKSAPRRRALARVLVSSVALWLAGGAALMLPAHSVRAAPQVHPVTAAALKKQIAARRGKVVLVNFWATSCKPCVEEFPALLRLRRNYASKGLAVLFVSADFSDLKTRRTKVQPFLAAQKMTGPSWIIGNPFHFIPQFDPAIEGAFALPRSYIYNRQGKLVKASSQIFPKNKSYAAFEKMVKPLL